MAKYEVHLQPVANKDGDLYEDVCVYDKVEVGFNQLGWLMLTDEKREVVACFAQGTVKYFERREPVAGEIIQMSPEDIVSVN